MNIKRIMALVLALVMVLSLVVMGFQVLASEETTKPAPDVDLEDDDDFTLEFDDLVDAVGTQTNPIEITSLGDFGVDVKAGGEVYYAISPLLNGYYLTIIGTEDMTVTLNGVELDADEEDIFTAELTEPAEGNVQHMLVIGNPTETDVETTGNLNTAPGTENNPVFINKIQNYNYVKVPANGNAYVVIAGNLSGYEVVVEGEGLTAMMGVAPIFTALTNENGALRGVADGAPTVMMMITNTTAEDVEAAVKVDGIFVNWNWNEEQSAATATVTVPAGKTYYYGATVSGLNLSINGEVYGMLNGSRWSAEIFSITNSGADAATYELTIAPPEGNASNPAKLVMGENKATVAEGNSQGYYYTWTATEDGTLTITMPTTGDWTYVINNLTTWVHGDMQWSDSDPVVNPGSVEVAAGDELQIIVNTYDPEAPWAAPEGTIAFTAAFEPAIVKFTLAGANMTLGNELSMNFFVNKTDYKEGFYAEITKTDYYGNVTTTKCELVDNPQYSIYKVATFNGIAAKQMGDKLEVVIYNSQGVAVSEIREDSVKAYCGRALTGTSNAEVLAMIVDMLNYGAEAQKQFNYDKANLVNADLTEAQKALGLKDSDINISNKQVKGTGFVGANLTLESKIELNFNFDKSVVTKEAFGYARIVYTDHNGNAMDYTVEEYKLDKDSKYAVVTIDQIALADAFSLVTVTVYDKDGAEIAQGTDSVESYAYRAIAATNSPLYISIMKFAQAAHNYFH